MCLPLLIFPCTIKSRSSLLAPAQLGGPGKRAVKQLWCGGGGDSMVGQGQLSSVGAHFKIHMRYQFTGTAVGQLAQREHRKSTDG